jgi:hypothetical protein
MLKLRQCNERCVRKETVNVMSAKGTIRESLAPKEQVERRERTHSGTSNLSANRTRNAINVEETILEGIMRKSSGGLEIDPRIHPLRVLVPVRMEHNVSSVGNPGLRERIALNRVGPLRLEVSQVVEMVALRTVSRGQSIGLQIEIEVALSQGSGFEVRRGRRPIVARGSRSLKFRSPKENVVAFLKREVTVRRVPIVISLMLPIRLIR